MASETNEKSIQNGMPTPTLSLEAKTKRLLDYLSENPFVLAPMAGITDMSFRSFQRELGAGVVVTELVSATGLNYLSPRTEALMSFSADQHPVGIQLFGEDPEHLASAALMAEKRGCDFIDMNFGCPVPKVVKKGGGSAMLKDLVLMRKVLTAIKDAIQIPLTIKIRTGWDENSRNAIDVARLASEVGVAWVAIHGRTRSAGYSGNADWQFIREVNSAALQFEQPIPILGNGDITSGSQAVARLEESGCAGVLIGRGCLRNPFIFVDAMRALKKEILAPKDQDMVKILRDRDLWLAFLRLHSHISRNCAEPIALIQAKKYASWFSSGYAGASNFRRWVFQTKNLEEVLEVTKQFFISIKTEIPADVSAEPFLMGGHG